jgi:WD40 repeat protein
MAKTRTTRILLPLLLMLLAACGAAPTPAPPQREPTADITPTAPSFSEPIAAISAENADRIRYLGRLDPDTTRPSTVFAHDFSPDGIALATLNNDVLSVWDLVNGTSFFNVSRGQSNHVYFAPDKADIYTITTEGDILIYDATSGARQTTLSGHETYSGAQAYYDFDGLLALGGVDGTFKLWEVVTRTARATVTAGNLPLDLLTFSNDGRSVASFTLDADVQVWDWAERSVVAAYDHDGAVVQRLAFSPDDTLLASATAQQLYMWRLPNDTATPAALLYTLPLQPNGAADVFAFSPDGRYLLLAGGNADMLVIDVGTGKVFTRLLDVSGDRMSADFSPDSSLMVTTVFERAISLWNLAQADETIPRADLDLPTRRIVSADWSDDGLTIAFFDATGSVHLYGISEP